MVYNWDDKEGECYRLYVEEKRSLDEVIAYWEVRGFTPRYVTARLHVRVAVNFWQTSHQPSVTHNKMLTMMLKQTSFPDTVQGTLNPRIHPQDSSDHLAAMGLP
jgi:hypothetical protein